MIAGFPHGALAAALTGAERRALAAHLAALLRWQETLARYPRPLAAAPDATPFVSLRARGQLRGCHGSGEGPPPARLDRAFLHALEDTRYGRVSAAERAVLDAQVSYPYMVSALDPADPALVEPGRHGVAVVGAGRSALLLPSVAADLGAGGAGMIEVAARKAGLSAAEAAAARWFRFEVEEVSARAEPGPAAVAGLPWRGAVAWLERQVLADGRILFGVDPRTGVADAAGPMLHGRAAVALQALARAGSSPARLRRGRAWLGAEIARGLRGEVVPCWPGDPALVGGTLALAVLAGLPLAAALVDFCEARPEVARHRWHAGQVGAALGPRTPPSITAALLGSGEEAPSPWSLLAARARGDGAVVAREAAAVAASLRPGPPGLGAVTTAAGAELALTALATESLAGLDGAEARAAWTRGRAFLTRHQLLPGATPLAVPERLVAGAFPLTRTNLYLRVDVTAHAILALA